MSKLTKIAFVFGFFSVLSMAITRYLLGDWVPFCWLALGLAVFFFGFGIYKDRAFFKEFFSMKTTKEGMSMGSLILMMIALLVVVNYLGIKHYKSWDFSSAKANSLSAQSLQLTKGLDSELKVYFFYKKGVQGNEDNRREFRELINKYQDVTEKIRLEFVEVNEKPDLAKDFGVDKGSGVAFIDFKGRRNRIEKVDEQEFTSALVKVTREKTKTIYFTVGHGEKDLNDSKEGLGLGSLKLMLENNRYTVKELSLQTSAIPEDADVIVIAGPIRNFQDSEITALENHLKKGKNLLLAIESQNTANLDKLVAKMGVKFGNNYIFNVVDTEMGRGLNQGPAVGAVFSAANKITRPFSRTDVTMFRMPQALIKGDVPEGMVVDELVKTAPTAMAFDSMQIRGDAPEATYTLVDEVIGRWPGADEKAGEFSVIIAGDVDFMTNQMLYQNLNRDLVLNSIASLAKEENLISITPKEAMVTPLFMTETKFSIFLFAFIIPLPILLLGASVGLWLKRRNA